MANKQGSRKNATTSSSKILKPSGKTSQKAPQKSAGKATTTSKKVSAKKSSKKVSYKEQYIKLLERTNKTLTKEVKAIKKAIDSTEYKKPYEAFPKDEPVYQPPYEAFPKDEPVYSGRGQEKAPTSIEEQILESLKELEQMVRSRDMIFEDLVSGNPKLTEGETDFNG
jgi:anti-sigma28 factor (negative regulator of flagellin synthesis)